MQVKSIDVRHTVELIETMKCGEGEATVWREEDMCKWDRRKIVTDTSTWLCICWMWSRKGGISIIRCCAGTNVFHIPAWQHLIFLRTCTLVWDLWWWSLPGNCMWRVKPDFDHWQQCVCSVIHLDSILHAAHLLPIFGEEFIPRNLWFYQSLCAFQLYYVNMYADHHSHEVAF